MSSKTIYIDFIECLTDENRVRPAETKEVPALLCQILSQEELDIYRMHLNQKSLKQIGEVLGIRKHEVYRKLSAIKRSVKMLLALKKAFAENPVTIESFLPEGFR